MSGRACEGCAKPLTGKPEGVRFHGASCRARASRFRRPTRALTVLAYIDQALADEEARRQRCAFCGEPIRATTEHGRSRRRDALYCGEECRRAASHAGVAQASTAALAAEREAAAALTAQRDAATERADTLERRMESERTANAKRVVELEAALAEERYAAGVEKRLADLAEQVETLADRVAGMPERLAQLLPVPSELAVLDTAGAEITAPASPYDPFGDFS